MKFGQEKLKFKTIFSIFFFFRYFCYFIQILLILLQLNIYNSALIKNKKVFLNKRLRGKSYKTIFFTKLSYFRLLLLGLLLTLLF